MCACADCRATSGVTAWGLATLLFEIGSFTGTQGSLIRPSLLAGEGGSGAPDILLDLPSPFWGYKCELLCLAFTRVWRIELESSPLHKRGKAHFTN